MASTPSRYAWVRLTYAQLDALHDLARVIAATPDSLSAALPTVGQRAAFRGLVRTVAGVRGGQEVAQS